ncbi:cytidine deaminase [Athalassotoga saccharophila]|uniref:cytidine deaminase n=1 Tax=Athalassotoga saccharophila TaxID=1441386 RepID=UPI00137AB268|nr:cytidine deaminase [Athalassotoga saccharophila]BBJ28402.1 cytidine deaminase [Athalassotoga saccharophila]
MTVQELINKAKEAKKHAYAPYSNFAVGAAVETESGRVYTGCNVENSSFGLSMCAERIAIFKAVSEGEKKFKRIAIVADTKGPVSPCGACRQVMAEFGNFEVILSNENGDVEKTTVEELLPGSFDLRRDKN